MIRAYAEHYLHHARHNFGQMLDTGVNQFHCPLDVFYQTFLSSPLSLRFAGGEPSALVGHSGWELAYEVLKPKLPKRTTAYQAPLLARSQEYWTGWALAYYQFQCAWSFQEIESFAPIVKIKDLYHPFHEMDILHFVDFLNQCYKVKKHEARLKSIRRQACLSQTQLAVASGVPCRTIQQYEQFQKNINNARGVALLSLANALHCAPAQLLEPARTERT